MTYVRAASDIAKECGEKEARLLDLMREKGLDAFLISRHENIAWLTAGITDIRVGLLRETGPASLLITKEGERFYVTTENEAQRLADEEFAGLHYKPVLRPWYSLDAQQSIQSVVQQGRLGTDAPLAQHAVVNLQPLRMLLTPGEIDRYRWLGRQVAEVATSVVGSLEPGMTERSIQATVAHQLISQGLLPSVYLEAVDQRMLSYPHPVPREGVLERFAMVGFCARFGGLTASITRLVHFGPLSEDFRRDFSVVTQVNARILASTREGATADDLFSVLREGYAAAGAAGAEQRHHQGGATGYMEREWIARPGGTEQVHARQAFAWNPNLRGAKVEDTRLLLDDQLETVTRTPDLPEVTTTSEGFEYVAADVLIR